MATQPPLCGDESNLNRAEEGGRVPIRGRRGGRQDGRGRRRGQARNQTDYWNLAKPEFRRWLSNITTRAEYNTLSIAERGGLLHDFGTQSHEETLKRIEDKIDDMATVSMEMSEADEDFTRELLGSKGIVFKTLPVCKEGLEGAFLDRIYNWGEKEDEKDGQPGCKSMLERELLPVSLDGRALGIFDVRGLALPEVHEGKRKSNGFSDLAVGDLESLSLPDTRDLTFGLSTALIELTTAKAALKQGQLLLQLVSLSTISNARKGVVVLGTDCATKWRLVYFTKFNEITIQQYTCGEKCLEDFGSLIQASAEKAQSLVPIPLPPIREAEYAEGAGDSANTAAHLDAVARHLAGLFPSERDSLTPMVDENRNPPPMIFL